MADVSRIFLISLLVTTVAFADVAPDWHEGFGTPPTGLGLDGDPRALLFHSDGSLYVGGSFSQAGPLTTWFAARLDQNAGTYSWASLGDFDNRIDALVAWGDSVLAGGRFTDAGGVDVNRVAVWNGAAWSPVGDPAAWTWGHVLSLTMHDGTPWAAGTGFVVRWTGAAWETVTGTFSGDVFALASYEGELYAGGAFSSITDAAQTATAAANIALWDGTWQPLGAGLNGTCYALTLWDDRLVAGGVFSTPSSLIASWDGGFWSSVGDPLFGGFVTALDAMGPRLYVGGDLYEAGGVAVSNIAQLSNDVWWDLGYGVDGMVRALANNGSVLVAGGAFLNAGEAPSSHLGIWIDPTVGITTTPAALRVGQPYPNPFNPGTRLTFSLAASGPVLIRVHDAAGRRVRTLVDADVSRGSHTIAWDGRDDAGRVAASGTYVTTIQAADVRISRTMVLLK